MSKTTNWKRKGVYLCSILLILGAIGGGVAWYKFFRVVPQAPFETAAEKFMYQSLGSEEDRGIPYPIFVVLPRIFPDLLPGPGGYRSLGLPWEEGKALPVGFSLKTMGFQRVTQNCSVCHAATYRTKKDESPRIQVAGPGHTTNVQAFLRFIGAAAKDPRFSAERMLPEIMLDFDLSWLDVLIYKFILIPMTQKAILEQDAQFAWMNRPNWPDWGPGRDDPMNLTKYFMIELEYDQTVGQADFPSIWNLGIREGHSLNWGGETLDSLAVIMDSALGLGAPPGDAFVKQMTEINEYLKAVPAPKFPQEFSIDGALAERGRAVYMAECANCHHEGGKRTGSVIPIDEIGTDRERFNSWSAENAEKTNAVAASMGVSRKDMIKDDGYVSAPLDGIWLRAPYLHNGAVPSLADLLESPSQRTKKFYRGYDVYDPVKMGFVSEGVDAKAKGFLLDTAVRGNGNAGHEYGTSLPVADKAALIEYMKRL